MVAGVMRIDEIIATLVVILEDEHMQFCSGYVHGASITAEPPVYAQEAGVLHALRATKEWISHKEQSAIKWIEMRVGDARANYHIREWMRVGRCTFDHRR